MRILLSVVFVCLCITTQAQKKNEIQIGVPAAYFFDDTPYRFHDFKRGGALPTHISYTRSLSSKYGLCFNFNHLWLVYDIDAQDNYPGEIFLRGYSKISVEFYQQKKFGRFSIRGKLGTGYRFGGGESYIVLYGYDDGFSLSNGYNDLGLSIGIQANYRLFGQLSAVAQVDFSRYFSTYSPNELHNVFGLSYGF